MMMMMMMIDDAEQCDHDPCFRRVLALCLMFVRWTINIFGGAFDDVAHQVTIEVRALYKTRAVSPNSKKTSY